MELAKVHKVPNTRVYSFSAIASSPFTLSGLLFLVLSQCVTEEYIHFLLSFPTLFLCIMAMSCCTANERKESGKTKEEKHKYYVRKGIHHSRSLGIINDSPGDGGGKISYVAGTWWWWSHNLICKKDAELDADMARSAD